MKNSFIIDFIDSKKYSSKNINIHKPAYLYRKVSLFNSINFNGKMKFSYFGGTCIGLKKNKFKTTIKIESKFFKTKVVQNIFIYSKLVNSLKN